jgi:uncharacterized DUF497 family protein
MLEFEWDSEKADANLKKHKVSFEEAATIFGDPLSLTAYDPDHSQNRTATLQWERRSTDGCSSSRIQIEATRFAL